MLALASYPRFDPNAFIRGLTEEEFSLYFEDERQPFVNRTSEQLYPPGSTFKVVTLAAALEVAGLEPSARRDCPAVWTGLGEDTPLVNWKEDDRGLLTLTQALAESCNSVFYQLATELHGPGRAGAARVRRRLRLRPPHRRRRPARGARHQPGGRSGSGSTATISGTRATR